LTLQDTLTGRRGASYGHRIPTTETTDEAAMGAGTESTTRLDLWRDLIREHFVALDIDADRDGAFTGTVRSAALGHLKVASVDTTTAEYRRTRGLAHRDSAVYLQVGLITCGEAVLRQDGREAALRPGDFAIYETDRPFFWGLRGESRLFVFTWPRASMALDQGESQRLTARTLGGGSGLGGIVGRMLQELVTSPPALSAAGGVRLADEVGELVTTVATEYAEPGPPGRAVDEELRRIDAYIAERLCDPDLDPAAIARAHFMSVRRLHRLFARQGTSVTQRIRQQRLERCRHDLARPRGPASISDISRRWGFTDLATFSRAFRSAYRTTPSAYRRRANGGW
jgi:AraC-like DNA-binding protein